MTKLEQAGVALAVGLSGAAVMAAINWQGMGPGDWPLILFACAGATLAGALFAGWFGGRWPMAVIASLNATVVGAAAGALLVLPRPEALMMGPYFVIASLLDSPFALAVWAASQLAAHAAAWTLRRRRIGAPAV